MSKILLINPNKWGRGITHIWIATHVAVLKEKGHDVKLFDCTFYSDWTDNEIAFNTDNLMYKKSDYDKRITFNKKEILKSLQELIDNFQPEFIFWSAISSHIHAEGEYVNIEYGYRLLNSVKTSAIKVTGGLQVIGSPKQMFKHFPNVDYFIQGESEFVLPELINKITKEEDLNQVLGLIHLSNDNKVVINRNQSVISNLDAIPPYDYTLFDEQVFFRPYNGDVVRAVDYELSRGCIYSCEYCVETVIQSYYGFDEIIPGSGTIKNAKKYLRNKSADRIFKEINNLYDDLHIRLFRCQDTNFLTIDQSTLKNLADMINDSNMDIMLYIETRPEGINNKSIELLKKLKVDGVGMGIEVSTQDFREEKLRRFANQEKIINAFKLLKQNNIKRTAYNIIGLPEQDEASILDTIRFNQDLDPDNITVAFYSPYIGTSQQKKANELGYFRDYEHQVDSALRSLSKDSLVDNKTLTFYKDNFNNFVKKGIPDKCELIALKNN